MYVYILRTRSLGRCHINSGDCRHVSPQNESAQ